MDEIKSILSSIMGSLEFTEGYGDAYWYIYRSETSLEDDLRELQDAISRHMKE